LVVSKKLLTFVLWNASIANYEN